MANPIYGPVSRASAPAMWMVIFCIACTAALMVGAADPDPLQDFCVADLSPTAPKMHEYSCKDRATVTAKDFLHTAFRKAGNTSYTHKDAIVTLAIANQFTGLNTLGIWHARLDFAKGGIVPPHTHPLASKTLFVVEGTVTRALSAATMCSTQAPYRRVTSPSSQSHAAFSTQRWKRACHDLQLFQRAGSPVPNDFRPTVLDEHTQRCAREIIGHQCNNHQGHSSFYASF